jgi:hypothetical protein
MVQKIINEINAIVLKVAPRHQVIEQAPALYPLDSNPKKDDANGQTEDADEPSAA